LTHTLDNYDVTTLQLDQNGYLAAERKMGKFYDRGRKNRRNAGIYRISTALQHTHAGFDG
jgi:homogentisate 1,2-dioxygenase